MPAFCFDDRLLRRTPRLRPAHPVPARVPGGAARRHGRARRRPGPAPRAAGARARRAGGRGGGRRGPLQRRRGPVRPSARRGGRAGPGRARREGRAPPGCDGARRPGGAPHADRQAVHRLLAPFTAPGSRRRAGTCGAHPGSCPRCRLGWRRGRCRRSPHSDSSRRSRSRRAGASRRAGSAWRSSFATAWRAYADNHDALGRDRTSRLSPYLHFGCVSAREVEERLPRGAGAEAFRRQLCWRDFHHHVLLHFPRNARSEFQERYRGSISWSYARGRFEAWCDGRTGFPLVDAGMRQLRREGWMHNRARLVVGLVPDEGPGDRLALGRALVHAPARGRRRGEQQRQLAVDRLRRHGSPARLPPDLQPGAPHGALRPKRRLRAPLRARAALRARRASGRAVDGCPRSSSATWAA